MGLGQETQRVYFFQPGVPEEPGCRSPHGAAWQFGIGSYKFAKLTCNCTLRNAKSDFSTTLYRNYFN